MQDVHARHGRLRATRRPGQVGRQRLPREPRAPDAAVRDAPDAFRAPRAPPVRLPREGEGRGGHWHCRRATVGSPLRPTAPAASTCSWLLPSADPRPPASRRPRRWCSWRTSVRWTCSSWARTAARAPSRPSVALPTPPCASPPAPCASRSGPRRTTSRPSASGLWRSTGGARPSWVRPGWRGMGAPLRHRHTARTAAPRRVEG